MSKRAVKSWPLVFIQAALLLFIVLLVYQATSGFGFLWDDHQHIQANKHWGTADGLVKIWTSPGATSQYYPLTFSVFWAIERLFGLDPAAFHLANVVVHGVNAILLFLLLRHLGLSSAFWAALVFAVHPVMVETVVWPLEMKNLLSTFFYLLACHAYLRFYGRSRDGTYFLALILFTCALLCKTTAATFCLAVPVILWWKYGRPSEKDAALLVPFVIIAAILGRLTATLEAARVGASGPEWDLSIVDRVLIAGKAVWFYFGKVFFPVDLMFVYPRWDIKAATLWTWSFPLGVVIVLAGLWSFRRRIGNGPLAAVLFFIVTLLPALGFINFYPMRFSFVADHFQYLASIGIIVLLTESLVHFMAKRNMKPVVRIAVPAFYAIVLAVGTILYLPAFRDQSTQWTRTIDKNPSAWLAYANRGVLLARAGQTRQALDDYDKALELIDDADIHFNRGNAYLDLGEYHKAVADFSRAIGLFSYRDAYYNNRGLAYLELGEHQNALSDFKEAIRLNPRHKFAWANKGKAHWHLEQTAEGLAAIHAAMDLGADQDEVYYYEALLLKHSGRYQDAAAAARRACDAAQNKTYCDLAVALDGVKGQDDGE